MRKHWTLHVINHSHTDIGYTERQEKLTRYHVDFIRQAVEILRRAHADKPEWLGYLWTCENTWQVECFLQEAPQRDIDDFWQFVKSGEISLAGNYLNMTELIDMHTLLSKTRRALIELRKHAPVKSAMTADINGYAWGYAQALVDCGITSLISCIHTHHGMYPNYMKQRPFWWEAPNGEKLLVWVADQYHLGNEFMIAPNAPNSYSLRDELVDAVYEKPFEVAETRIARYLENLEGEGYPYDMLPIMVSGIITDNGAPNGRIMEFIRGWNEKHGGQITLKMSSPEGFFAAIQPQLGEVPTFRGDFTDWWADGVGSTPAAVKALRDAQRRVGLAAKLDPEGNLGDPALLQAAEDGIMLYAEHTWGYSSSVSEPWVTLVNDLDLRKTNHAVNASVAAARNLDKILAAKGETSIRPDREKLYVVVNPHNEPVHSTAILYLEHWEMLEGAPVDRHTVIEAVDETTGEVLPCQWQVISRALEVEVDICLMARQERTLRLRRGPAPAGYTSTSAAAIGAEGVTDLARVPVSASVFGIENDFYSIRFDNRGICRWVDKKDGADLLRAGEHPFAGLYQRTDAADIAREATNIRRMMGRNRSAVSTKTFEARLSNIQVMASGDVYDRVRLDYELEGTRMYSVVLKAYRRLPRVSAAVIVHKESRWEPENLYIPLPFTTGADAQLYVEKTGCVFRPGIDQIPGTCMDFYALQSGMAYVSEEKSLSIALRDAPLVTLAPLAHHPIELCSGQDVHVNRATVHSWAMNNFWETNFKVDLGGFYEFQYDLYLAHGKQDAGSAIETCRILNEGIVAFPV